MCLTSNQPADASASADADLLTFLVEDSLIIREHLLTTLEELVGITPVGFAAREDQASNWLVEHATQWNLAIVDIALQQGTGFGVLQACRKRQPWQKVVVLSNYAGPMVTARCMALGADAVFDKSADIDKLIDFCLRLRAYEPSAHGS